MNVIFDPKKTDVTEKEDVMKLMIDGYRKHSKGYMKEILLDAVKRVAVNPVLLKLIQITGHFSYLNKMELQEGTVLIHETGGEAAYIRSAGGSELEVSLPAMPYWHNPDICSPLGVTEVPEWIDFILKNGLCGPQSEWFVDLGENYMRLDMLAQLLQIPIEVLLAMKFVAPDGTNYSAICNRNCELSVTPTSPVDIRAVLAAAAIARFAIDT